ncbi:hypothetical protein C5B42_01960 [Candidatus Cerribacteria bacterium 'Amazon FNV 2010 28 9']|uniref:Uncharacterized protein n=1 Tax=Candidatus Cerribacteria bacterium 'Amazon FNV 2010 28 9' TaxID=2081795 RepID=A0A317JPU1_9BACT|nr:MAG: hypothetical protein C5B42_01960 [Candidatus Cerribacteria bacterium 'Amazon FNV 2010 28 9']
MMYALHDVLPLLEVTAETIELGTFDPNFPPLSPTDLALVLQQARLEFPAQQHVLILLYEQLVGVLVAQTHGVWTASHQFPIGLASLYNRLRTSSILTPFFKGSLQKGTDNTNTSYPFVFPSSTSPQLTLTQQESATQLTNTAVGNVEVAPEVFSLFSDLSSLPAVLIPNPYINIDEFFSTPLRLAREYYSTHDLPKPPAIQKAIDEDHWIYEHPGLREIEHTGNITPSYAPFIEDDTYEAVLTVNIFDGTASVYTFDTHHQPTLSHTYPSLVGARLPRVPALEQSLAKSMYGSTYHYDGTHGVLYNQEDVPRHTFTPPLVADYGGHNFIYGFGGLQTTTDVAEIFVHTKDGKSSQGSNFTFHQVPPVFDNPSYNGRRTALKEYPDIPLDPYWSHGCVNFLTDHFNSLIAQFEAIRKRGKKVGILFSYGGTNQALLPQNTSNYDGSQDPLFENNYPIWANVDIKNQIGGQDYYETNEPSPTFSKRNLKYTRS